MFGACDGVELAMLAQRKHGGKTMSVEWIDYQGKRILMCDHRNMDSAALIANLWLETEKIKDVPEPEKVLFLDDFEGATIDSAVMAAVKEVGLITEPRTERCAIVGIIIVALRDLLARSDAIIEIGRGGGWAIGICPLGYFLNCHFCVLYRWPVSDTEPRRCNVGGDSA